MSSYKLFAFCADQKVFFIHKIFHDQPSFKVTCDSYAGSPTFVECTDFPEASLITKDWKFNGEYFLPPDEDLNTCKEEIGNNYKFVLVSEETVTSWIMFPKDEPDSLSFLKNLKKNPVIVDITDLQNPPTVGWTFDGKEFFQ